MSASINVNPRRVPIFPRRTMESPLLFLPHTGIGIRANAARAAQDRDGTCRVGIAGQADENRSVDRVVVPYTGVAGQLNRTDKSSRTVKHDRRWGAARSGIN